jgi:hypothetical protein
MGASPAAVASPNFVGAADAGPAVQPLRGPAVQPLPVLLNLQFTSATPARINIGGARIEVPHGVPSVARSNLVRL